QGTGIINVDRAFNDLDGYTTPGGLVFYANPASQTSQTETVSIHRLPGADEATYAVDILSNQDLPGVSWSVSDDTVTTSSGEGEVDVTVTFNPAAMDSDDAFYSQSESDGWLVLTNTDDSLDKMVVGLIAVGDPASTVGAD